MRVVFVVAFAASLAACAAGSDVHSAVRVFPTPFSTEEAAASVDSPFAPLPSRVDLDPAKVALGERLYRDRRLSGDGTVACNDCHALDRGGADGRARSTLPTRPRGGVNVPSVFNAAFYFRFGWSGRFADIGEQLDVAMESKPAMAGTWAHAAAMLAGDVAIVREFAALYPEGLTADSLREAVAMYSLSLVTPNARFDRFLRGELALDPDEQRGYERFRDYGCVSCHQGIDIGGNMFQRFGVIEDYFAGHDSLTPADEGLFTATKRPEDRFVFRVPSLRNVALTPPYFHDASAATLDNAVVAMARYQLGRRLDAAEVGDIVAFLRALTGELPGSAL
jgi:cytochrome c peroxidase